ncbi:MAG: glycosyltransferase [Candidatus Thorarchaeota archaeon]
MKKLRILITSTSNPETNPRPMKLKKALQSMGHQVGTYWIRPRSRPRFLRQISSLIRTLRLAFNLENYDVLHLVDGWDLGLVPFIVSTKPIVFDIRSLWPFVGRRRSNDLGARILSYFRGLVTRRIVGFSDHVTTVDPHLAREVKRMKPKSLTYLRNLPSKDMFHEVPFASDSSTIDFGWIGSIDPNRRVCQLLKAWKAFVEEQDKDCRLWVYGWPSTDKKYFREEISPFFSLDTVNHVDRVPFDEIPFHYREMDFIVAPNAGDHWQLKLGEAIAAQVPLIVRHGKLHHKLIGDLGVVYFYSTSKETDVPAILAALHEAADNLDRLKSEAKEKTPPYWEDDVRRLVEVYKRLVTKSYS